MYPESLPWFLSDLMYVQIGCGAREVLVQQSVSVRACQEEAELWAEGGPDAPNYTEELGEGLGTTLKTHGLCRSSTPSSNNPSSVWKEPCLRCGWVHSPLTETAPNPAKPHGQEPGPHRDTNPTAETAFLCTRKRVCKKDNGQVWSWSELRSMLTWDYAGELLLPFLGMFPTANAIRL